MSAPTYEEVRAFAKSEGLDSKTNVRKFYDYYSRSYFSFKGEPMNWKAKLREWAGSERPKSRNYMTEEEKVTIKKENPAYPFKSWEEVGHLLDILEKEMKGWGK